ncbi:spermidine synthase [Paenibacillus nicotianae]|uniref:Spermidine synthase n=1 Tax=Paenibacillus nicotianae TaxID=1526551 RepID=A0ABW4USH9_9BACL
MHLLFHNQAQLSVYETNEFYNEKGSFRILQFANEDIQGAIDLHHPERILFEYPRAMIHLMELNNSEFQDVFVIGHGIGTIASHYPNKSFRIAEIDPLVLELSQTYFHYTLDNVQIGDGRLLLSAENNHQYDYIILDAFTTEGTPQHLISRTFFQLTATKLHDKGYLIINLIGKANHDMIINSISTTLYEVYTYIECFALPAERMSDTQNMIIIAGHQPIRYQGRHMAGFESKSLGQGYIIEDE